MATEGRSTVYNKITSPEKLAKVNPDNIALGKDFIEYLNSIDRAKSTITQYEANLNIFWCWNMEFNKDKFFVDMKKREFSKFQNHCINEWGWSPKRVRTVKATISSLSNFIENILDDEYDDYTPIVRKIESPADVAVREKSVFEPDDFKKVLDKLIENKMYDKACMLSLAINCGRRKAELPRMKVSYFNDENLICGGALYKTPEKIKTKGRGSRGKLLDVYILAKPFKPYLDMWLAERERLGLKSEWLFPVVKDGVEYDQPISTFTLDSWSRTYSNYMGSRVYIHCIRHTFTSYLLSQNLPESVVQNILGWESRDMVGVYDDRSQESQLEKYFDADGIKAVKQSALEDL